jgi:hypothetical protein
MLGHRAKMQNLTTASLVECKSIPEAGLTQSMYDRTKPLDLRAMLRSLGSSNPPISVSASIFFIADSIRQLYREEVAYVFAFSVDDALFPEEPIFDRISHEQTRHWQLGAIHENESTISGTYKVHDEIWIEQLDQAASAETRKKHRQPDDSEKDGGVGDYENMLWLAHDDQLTSHYIRAIKLQQCRATQAYDKKDWLLGIPSWFHIKMTLLALLIRTHWKEKDDQYTASHTFSHDTKILEPKLHGS